MEAKLHRFFCALLKKWWNDWIWLEMGESSRRRIIKFTYKNTINILKEHTYLLFISFTPTSIFRSLSKWTWRKKEK